MGWHLTDDVAAFLEATGELLLPEPGVHTIQLTAVANAQHGLPGFTFGWWTDAAGTVVTAVTHKPPYPLFVTPMPDDAVRPLVEQVEADAVAGPTATAVQVAATMAQVRGRTASLRFAERLFRLGTLAVPEVPGTARDARPDDRDLLVEWFRRFAAETGVPGGDEEESVDDRLGYRGLVVWEAGGEPVAVSGTSRVAFGSARIGPVFTPAEHRARGYGAAVTAAAARRLRERGGAEVVLFTDLTNATSNRVYAGIGFEPVHDVAVLRFDDAPAAGEAR